MIVNGAYPFIKIVASLSQGNTLTVTSVNNGVLSNGLMVGGLGVPANMFIIGQTLGAPGGPGTYLVGCYPMLTSFSGTVNANGTVNSNPIPLPVPGSGISSPNITLASQPMLVAPWTLNIQETLISQYANSPTLLALLNNINQYIDPQTNLFNFYNKVWNVNSATGYGLDLWGRIVGVSRNIFTNQASTYFNWYESTVGTLWGPGGSSPWINGAFGTGTTKLLDPVFCTLILAKALANISICSIPLVNKILISLFGQGVYVSDMGSMTMQINVTTTLSATQLAILNFSGVIPKPAGVQLIVSYSGPVTGTSHAAIPSITGQISSTGNVTGTTSSLAFKIVGSMSGTVTGVGGSTAVSLSNSTAYAGLANTVNTSGTVLITANVTGLANTTVTWKVDGVANGNSTVGTINTGAAMGTANQWGNTVLYTAPSTTGSHSIVAFANDGTPSPALVMSVQTKSYTVANATAYNVAAPTGNSTTDTASINAQLTNARNNGGGTVTLQTGNYSVTGSGSGGEYIFLIPGNTTLVIPTGCTVTMAAPASGGQCGIFTVAGSSNINIVGGGTINGNSAGGSMACILLEGTGSSNSSNICIAGLTIQHSSGLDGILTEGYYTPAGNNVTGVLIYGCTVSSNGRNGMAPCGVDNLVIRDCTMSNNSVNPAAGIDFEPTSSGSFVQRVTNAFVFNNVMNSNSDGSTYGGMIQSGPDDSGDSGFMNNITYAFNTGTGNISFGIEAQDAVTGLQILNNTVNSTGNGLYGGVGILLRGSSSTLSNVLILGNSLASNAGAGISLQGSMSGVYVEYNAMHSQSISTGSASGTFTVANNT